MNNPMWTLQEARILCEQVEAEFNRITLGAHVALGGSCLYRGSSEKDADLFIYPHKTTVPPKEAHVISALSQIGFKFVSERPHEQCGDDKRVLQFEYQEKRVDVFMMFPVEGQVWTLPGVDVAYTNSDTTARRLGLQMHREWMQGLGQHTPPPPTQFEIEQAMLDAAERAIPAYHGMLGPPPSNQ